MSLEHEKGARTRMTYYIMAVNIFVGIPVSPSVISLSTVHMN
jgi:hypothetical protein